MHYIKVYAQGFVDTEILKPAAKIKIKNNIGGFLEKNGKM